MKQHAKQTMLTVGLGFFLLQCSLPFELDTAAQKKISPVVQKWMANEGRQFSVMVTLKEQANLQPSNTLTMGRANAQNVYTQLTSVAQRTQGRLVKFLDEQNIKYQRFYIVNMLAIDSVDYEVVQQLAQFSEVEKIIANPVVKAVPNTFKTSDEEAPADEISPNGVEGNIKSIGAQRVWEELGVFGQGIVVAGQDTGVEWDHPALKAAYRGWDGTSASHDYSWHDAIHEAISEDQVNPCGYNSEMPCDDHGHGTHTIGTVVGDDGRGNQIGAAPKAKWMACHNMDSGIGKSSTYIECFEWFLAPYPYGGNPLTDGDVTKAPHIVNNSWECLGVEGCTEAETLPVLEKLKASGIFVVASAGNSGEEGCETIRNPPAMHSAATLSVGAHNHLTNLIASFSSRGPSKYDGAIGPDVTAPGVNIRSSVRGGRFQGFMWSGTSMAGPHVVGAIALLWSANPSLIGQVDAAADLIRRTATPTESDETCGGVPGTAIPNNIFGHGRLDVYKAVTESRQN